MATTNYGAYGAAAGSIFGAFTASMQIDAQNDAIAAQAQYNEDLYKSQEIMTKFAQDNNIEMMNNIQSQIEAKTANDIRTVNTQETKAVSKEAIRRGEGITAGNSVQRSVDEVIKKAQDVKNGVIDSYEQQANDLFMQVQRENQAEQIKLINSYNNMKTKNEQLAGQLITGLDSALKIGESAVGQALQGYNTGNAIGSAIGSTPSSAPTVKTNNTFDTSLMANSLDNMTTTDIFKIKQ